MIQEMILTAALALAADPYWVGRFSGTGDVPAPWRVIPYGDIRPTSYRLALVAGSPAIQARFAGSMALLARPIRVDMGQTPILCWRWLVNAAVEKADIRRKSGNDFAARVYVAFDMPDASLSSSTKFKLGMARRLLGRPIPDATVTYVWDNRSPVGTAVNSPYTDRQKLIVVQTGNERAGQWVVERADLATDFARSFGGKPGRPVELAVASDGDNTRSSGLAAFADIHFVGRSEECAI